MKIVVNIVVLFGVLVLGLVGCSPYKRSIDIPKGVFEEQIYITSEPTEAMIYINGIRVGETPFRTNLMYSEGRLINVKAVPLYPNQFTQNIFIKAPPIPKTMTIYMNEKPVILLEKDEVETLTAPDKRPPTVEIVTDTIYVDQLSYYVTPTIFFEFDKYSVQDSQKEKLNRLVAFLIKNRGIYVDVLGSADIRGTDTYNVSLSLRRAKSVTEYLIAGGVTKTHITTRAIGEAEVYDQDENPLEYQQSRFVHFKLFKLKKGSNEVREIEEEVK